MSVRDATRSSVISAGAILLLFVGFNMLFVVRATGTRLWVPVMMGLGLLLGPMVYWPKFA